VPLDRQLTLPTAVPDAVGRRLPAAGWASTIAVTVIAGPLDDAGQNPKVTECDVPEPPR
jgi:hypothetical protein